MADKKIVVQHYKCDFEVNRYLNPPIGEARQDLSAPHYGNFIQFRSIAITGPDILGRLCKVQQTNKPTVGKLTSDDETPLVDDVISSAVFRYNIANKILLIQTGSITSRPGSVFLKLMKHINQNLTEEYNIDPILEPEKIKALYGKKGLISQIRIATDNSSQVELLKYSGEDVQAPEDLFDYVKKLGVVITPISESVTKSSIDYFVKMFRKRKYDEVKFSFSDGEPAISLSDDFIKTDILFIPVDGSGNIIRENLYNQLMQIQIQS